MKKKITLLMALVVIFMCGITARAEDYSISQNKATVNVGGTIDLDVSGTDKVPVWTSYNANIARVNQKGEVTALKAGKTVIRVRAGSEYRTCAITVVDSSIKLNKTDAVIYHGGTSVNTVQLKATLKGASRVAKWYSSDTSVATVDEKGKVTSVSAGAVVITADANGKTASCTVTVKESSIFLDMDSMQLSTKGAGSSVKVTPTIIGSKKSVQWTTSDKTIATVSGGKVTGKKTGAATITATANGVSASCSVNVTEGRISISEKKVLLYSNTAEPETKQLKTSAEKQDAVTWTSSNLSVAAVSDKGLVTAIGAGTAVVSAEYNGNIDKCEVIVKETSTEIAEASVSLRTKGADKTYTLTKEIVGRKSTVKWASSDKNVATVSNGKVTAKKAGTATITATANGVSDTVVVNVSDSAPSVKLNQQRYVLYTGKGNTVTLKAVVDGASKSVTWESTDSTVAAVTNQGKVTAVKEGTAIITATANGVSDTCRVTVKESAVRLSSSYLKMSKGGTAKLAVDITGTSQTVKWSSTNSKAVTVKNGVITAKKDGEADIKATANGVTAICHILVDSSGCSHIYDGGVVTKDATCMDTGIITYTCAVCGDDYNVDTAATAHKYNDKVVEPTCVEAGFTQHTCILCGDSYTDSILEAKGHAYGEWVIEKGATTEETGLKSRTCVVCGDRQKEELPMIPEGHEHQYIDKVVPPTCKEQGYTTHVCECGAFLPNDTYTDVLGHSYSKWKVVTEATETTEGIRERTCARCGEKETETIPATTHVHSYVVGGVTKPTCIKQGYTTYSCGCGDSYTDNYTDALGHSYIEEITAPTCKEQGYTTYTCKECGFRYVGNYVDALEHSYTEEVIEPTCTMQGYTTYTCKGCGLSYRDNFVDALEHSYTEKVTEPPCIKQGYTTYTCTGCGNIYVDDYVEALGHEAGEWIITREPTCTVEGLKERWCIRCDFPMESVHIDGLLEHDYQVKYTKEPTNCGGGYTVYECVACGDKKYDDYVPYTGDGEHEWDYYNITSWGADKYQVFCKICGSYSILTMDEILEERELELKRLEAETKIKELVAEIITEDMNDVEKILAVNNWICLNCYYDYDTYHKNENYDHDSYTAYGAICKGKAVCAGYAKAFKEFMKVLGIECRYVRSTSLNHAWNQVKLDDGWYWIDCTWNDDDDDDFYDNFYFLKTGQRVDDEEGGTVCDGTKWVNGGLLLFGKYKVSDASGLNGIYELQKDNDAIYFLFDSEADYKEMWSIPSEYWDKYEESLVTYIKRIADTSDNSEKYLITIKNTDNVRALFEERMIAPNTDNESETDESDLGENTDTIDENPAVETTGETEIVEDKCA